MHAARKTEETPRRWAFDNGSFCPFLVSVRKAPKEADQRRGCGQIARSFGNLPPHFSAALLKRSHCQGATVTFHQGRVCCASEAPVHGSLKKSSTPLGCCFGAGNRNRSAFSRWENKGSARSSPRRQRSSALHLYGFDSLKKEQHPRWGAALERVMGIEPTSQAWEAGILPMNYTRIGNGIIAERQENFNHFLSKSPLSFLPGPFACAILMQKE